MRNIRKKANKTRSLKKHFGPDDNFSTHLNVDTVVGFMGVMLIQLITLLTVGANIVNTNNYNHCNKAGLKTQIHIVKEYKDYLPQYGEYKAETDQHEANVTELQCE